MLFSTIMSPFLTKYIKRGAFMNNKAEWNGFKGTLWRGEINLRDFIQHNYTEYTGDEKFLAGPTDATNKLWKELQKLQKEERAKGGVLIMRPAVGSTLIPHAPLFRCPWGM